jgi:hypothetical protein
LILDVPPAGNLDEVDAGSDHYVELIAALDSTTA